MYPGHARTSTRCVNRRAMATVSSVLCESTTTISSAQATDAKASAMSAASFLVMTVTETGGTRAEVYSGSLRGDGAWGLGLALRLEAEACGLRLTPTVRSARPLLLTVGRRHYCRMIR